MRRRATILLVAAAALLVLAAPAYAGETDCSDFKTQAEAQRHFNSLGGSPTNNVDGLDRDGDGIACEGNDRGAGDLPRSSDTPADQPGTSGEKLPFTGPGSTTAPLAVGLFGAGALLLLTTRYRGHHAR